MNSNLSKHVLAAAVLCLTLASAPASAAAVNFKLLAEAAETLGGVVGTDCMDPSCIITEVPSLPDASLGAAPDCVGVPIADGGNPGSGATWQILQSVQQLDQVYDYLGIPLAHDEEEIPMYYTSFSLVWVLSANTLNNGADGYTAGAVVHGDGWEVGNVAHGRLAQSGCTPLGALTTIAPPIMLGYLSQGGAWGVSGEESCSHTASISVAVGVEYSVTGPAVSGQVEMGTSFTCGESTTFDSEVVWGQKG